MNGLAKALAAEFIGTFALVFFGAGAVAALGGDHLPAIALAHGLTIMVFASAFGDISGCHINAAVTLGLAAAGQFPRQRVAPYIVAQLAGAIVAPSYLRRSAPSSSSTQSCTQPCAAPQVSWPRSQ
jgi:aquaporin Z